MTLLVLDPGFFLQPELSGGAAEERLLRRVEDANLLLRLPGFSLLSKVGDLDYFGEVYRSEGPDLSGAGRSLKQAVDRLREFARRGRVLPRVPVAGRVWGVRELAAWSGLGKDWTDIVTEVLGAALLQERPEDVAVLCNHIEGRNARERSSGGVELIEVTRWRLYAALQGRSPAAVRWIARPRHVEAPFSIRMDGRLPAAPCPGAHPFCLPPGWERRSTRVWAVHSARPCWIDAQGNAWARPATGGGYHWDVYLKAPALHQRIGLNPINVTQHGAPPGQGQPGDLHHVPTGKQGRLKDRSGWSCP